MKVDNSKLKTFKQIKNVLAKLVPDFMEIIDHKRVCIKPRDPSWNAPNNQVIGGIDLDVELAGVRHGIGQDIIRMGVRTDKDGLIDMGKLSAKISLQLNKMKSFCVNSDANEKKNFANYRRQRDNDEILCLLDQDGIISKDDYVPSEDGFYVTFELLSKEELLEFVSFKNSMIKRRKAKETQ